MRTDRYRPDERVDWQSDNDSDSQCESRRLSEVTVRHCLALHITPSHPGDQWARQGPNQYVCRLLHIGHYPEGIPSPACAVPSTRTRGSLSPLPPSPSPGLSRCPANAADWPVAGRAGRHWRAVCGDCCARVAVEKRPARCELPQSKRRLLTVQLHRDAACSLQAPPLCPCTSAHPPHSNRLLLLSACAKPYMQGRRHFQNPHPHPPLVPVNNTNKPMAQATLGMPVRDGDTVLDVNARADQAEDDVSGNLQEAAPVPADLAVLEPEPTEVCSHGHPAGPSPRTSSATSQGADVCNAHLPHASVYRYRRWTTYPG